MKTCDIHGYRIPCSECSIKRNPLMLESVPRLDGLHCEARQLGRYRWDIVIVDGIVDRYLGYCFGSEARARRIASRRFKEWLTKNRYDKVIRIYEK